VHGRRPHETSSHVERPDRQHPPIDSELFLTTARAGSCRHDDELETRDSILIDYTTAGHRHLLPVVKQFATAGPATA